MAVMTRDNWTDGRLDDLNGKVDRLDERMEAGFTDTRNEFRTFRAEMKAQGDGLRKDLTAQGGALRTEMTTEFRAVRAEIGALNRSVQQLAFGLIGAVLLGFFGTIAAIVTLV
jgi:hypothetical protein